MAKSGRPKKHDPLVNDIRRKIRANETKGVIDLLKGNVDLEDGLSRTPLFYAVLEDNFEIINWLLKNGTNCNHQDRNGWSSLHSAAQKGSVESVRLLLENEANPNLVDEYGNEPLWTACHEACLAKSTENNFEVIKLLIGAGANINNKNKHNLSPLNMAEQRSEIVLGLLRDTTF